jgi:hypothetical protein
MARLDGSTDTADASLKFPRFASDYKALIKRSGQLPKSKSFSIKLATLLICNAPELDEVSNWNNILQHRFQLHGRKQSLTLRPITLPRKFK